MKIVVLVKQVPDTWSDRRLDEASGRVDRGASDAVVDEIDERAEEVALRIKDATDAEVVVLSMGPAGATDSLRKSLAMGADSAVHVLDPALAGADALRTATVLAAAISKIGFDLVIAGNEATDGRGGVVPAMIAELLGLPSLTFLSSVDATAAEVRGTRSTEDGSATVVAPLPAVVSVTESVGEARFPNLRSIMKARKKPLSVWSAADLGLPEPSSTTSVVTATKRPARAGGTVIVDEGDAAARLAEYLVSNRLA